MKYLVGVLIFVASQGMAEPTTYCCGKNAETAFKADLAEIVGAVTAQKFKGNEWEASRGTLAVEYVTSQGITFNNPLVDSDGTTYGLRSEIKYLAASKANTILSTHPRPDGWTTTSEGPLYGFGGRFSGHRSKLYIQADGIEVDFDGDQLRMKDAGKTKFIGFIDRAGFSQVVVGAFLDPDEYKNFWTHRLYFGGPFYGDVEPDTTGGDDSDKKRRECEEEGGVWDGEDCKEPGED
jgi:hypothetical protein